MLRHLDFVKVFDQDLGTKRILITLIFSHRLFEV